MAPSNTCARGRVFLGVEVLLILQFSIALFTGMVAATLVPPVRRSIPRAVEVSLWVVFVIVCVIGVLNITNPKVRELTTSAFWGVDQVINTLVGLMGAGVLVWIADHRFTIATWAVLVLAVDVLALAMVRSFRQARESQPQVRLGEWMVLPRTALAPERVPVPYALDELNRKWAAALAVAGTALFNWLVNLTTSARDSVLPRQAERLAHAAAAGRLGSREQLASLRDTASLLQFAARSWYTAAGAPAVNGLAAKATEAVHTARSGDAASAKLNARRMADIHVLLGAHSMGWYGPLRPSAAAPVEEGEKDATGQADRLAP